MSQTVKGQAGKQKAGPVTKKSTAANVPPRQAMRTPVAPAAQTAAKPPAQQVAKPPAVAQPKPLSTLMSTTALNGFSGFNEEVEGDDREQVGSMIQGTILKFSNEAEWLTGAGDPVSRTLELIVADLVRAAEKWVDQKRVETIIVPPGERFPNIKAMNAATPRSEWREYNGEMAGPWQLRYFVYFLDANTLDRYTFPTSSIGGGMCCREIADKVAWMHKYKGPKVSAVITLGDIFMNTKYGGRQRPHFNIVRWIGFNSGGDTLSPSTKAQELPWDEVEEPTLREELNDDLPDSVK
jgi:hypothetical protein